MIKYGDLVQYIKDNHVNWNTDLFDVLRGFFNQYSLPSHLSHTSVPLASPKGSLSSPSQHAKVPPLQKDLFTQTIEFKEPKNGEYTNQDLMNLFST